MKAIPESPPEEFTLQDKKRTPTEADTNIINDNNSNADYITSGDKKQSRINEAVKFFNLLYGKITVPHFAYLWTKQRGIFTFQINDATQRENMAKKAIELSDSGVDVWHSVNPVSVEPTNGKRGDENAVSYQIACVVDIDIRSEAHKGNPVKLAVNFEEAKSFLPFTPSLIIHSGYGLHAYYIFDIPIEITDENRDELKRRNNFLLDLIRARANGKTIDRVSDLPRIMRTPSTFNYKLGTNNAPFCRIVEDSDLLFSPTDLDAKLNDLNFNAQPAFVSQPHLDYDDNNLDLKEFRIHRMLDYINIVDGEYEKWLTVGFALFNENMKLKDWEQWSRTQPEFKEGECERKWKGFHHDPNGITIASLYQWATEGGYDEKEIKQEWYELHPESATKKKTTISPIDSLKAELRSVNKAIADFNTEQKIALESLRSIDTFDSATVFSDKVITAAAFAKLFDKQTYSNLKRDIKLYGDKHPTEKASVNDWGANVRDKATEISSRKSKLSARRNEIQARIDSLSFVTENNILSSFSFPDGYSISAQGGIVKIDGEKVIQVCRRPIVITGKAFSVEEKTYKIILSYMTSSGKWKSLPPTSAAIIANKNKIIDLAELGLPVTSSNATHIVDFLDAFNAQNENNCPMTYTVPRCGWYNFDEEDCFVDPRRECITNDEDKKVSVKVDFQSQFASSLRQVGKLEEWKKAYKLAKKSPIARAVVAASVAPILLKVLGERNFLLYVHAPTRAGKTTALYLGASAVGSEKMIRSFDATKNGLAGAAADVSDYAFLVDEKQVADNRLKEAFDNLVYALANGSGRTKLNKDSSLRKTADWRTIAIMTGETQLLADNVTGGANTRLLTISTSKEILSAADCKEIRHIIRDNHGHAFTLVISKIFEYGFEKLRNIYENLVDIFTKTYPELLSEYCRYMAIITLADTLLNSVLFGNTITTADGNTVKAIDDAKLNANEIFKLLPTTVEISDTGREKDFVLGFITQNQNSFAGGEVPLEKIPMIRGQFTDIYVYITVAALKKACNDEGFDYRKLAADLASIGFFVPSNKIEKGYKTHQTFVQKKIGKTNTRCYRIKRENIE